ncbi:MAG: hypothetical protein HY723_01645, partial [Chloroflexi bacterium]|nr:hypothetical protein [Chloroflexota bacterium]
MSALGTHDIAELERELSSLPPYRVPDELRRSLRARLISEAALRGGPKWFGTALWRTGALTAATVLLLSGVSWAVVASAPGDPLYAVRDVIARLVLPSARGVDPLPAGVDSPAATPDAVPADLPAPPSIAPAEASAGVRGPTATVQPSLPAPVTAPLAPAPVTAPLVSAPVMAPSLP